MSTHTPHRRVYTIGTIAVVFAYVVDRLLKLYSRSTLATDPLAPIPGWLELTYFENENIVFWFDPGRWTIVLGVTVVLLAVIYTMYSRWKDGHPYVVLSLLLVVAGAYSNLYDRVTLGFVVDMISIPFWTVFNLADLYVILGMAGYFFWTSFHDARLSKAGTTGRS